jgi:hypothetical protein
LHWLRIDFIGFIFAQAVDWMFFCVLAARNEELNGALGG